MENASPASGDKQVNLHKELELIQAVISRMSNNSFLIKGWTMTLMSAMFAFGKDLILNSAQGTYYLMIMVCIIIPFWWLDSFYLSHERTYRKIYQKVIHDPEARDRIRYDLSPLQLGPDFTRSVRTTMWTDFLTWYYLGFILFLTAGAILKGSGLLHGMQR